MTLKEQVFEACQQLISAKIAARQQALLELADSMGNETKSSAGDKYETGRAMLHIEQDNVRKGIAVLQAQKAVLDSIDCSVRPERAALGSLVEWCGGYFFLSIALGRLTVDGQNIIALSLQSPLGISLAGLQQGDKVLLNGKPVVLESIA